MSSETIKTFNLGYCSKTGQCSSRDFLPFIDNRFFDSVIFPIYDLHDNLISISARPLKTQGFKYIHTSYEKAKHLYGLNITHPYILKEKCVYIVEGNFDLLTLFQNGITNVVAMLGSQLSVDQISLLIRFTNEIRILADGDEAGIKCADKISHLLEDNNISFKRINLPKGMDPDTFIKSYGVEAFNKLHPQDLLSRIKGI